MTILPKNEPKVADKTPTNFLIWGPSMSGKTYLARQFPNPIILNTDGNGKKVETPSVDIRNFEHFIDVINALEKENHTYETIIIDLIDDIETMLTNHICDENSVNTIGEIKWGKGWSEQTQKWKKLMVRLANIKMNVIFISHIIEKSDNDNSYMTPSLPQKFLNMCMGRCDLSIKTTKIGNKYIRTVTERREAYTEDSIKDKKTLEILKDIIGVFDKPTSSNTSVRKTPEVKKEIPIVKEGVKEDIKPVVTASQVKPTRRAVKKVDLNTIGKTDQELKKDTVKDIANDQKTTTVNNTKTPEVTEEILDFDNDFETLDDNLLNI